MNNSHFSPFEVHEHLMDQIDPRLAYRGQEIAEWQLQLRDKVKELIAFPQKDRVPLNLRSLWQREHELGVIEKLIFTSEPYADVIAYLCLPNNIAKPYPFFICLQGHSSGAHNSIAIDREDNSTSIEVAGDRDFGLGCMARGVAALCIEQRSFGERRELYQKDISSYNGCHDAAMHALMLGRTLLGERVFDVDRGLDYLETRDDIDWTRLGVMGNSSGGTTSMFAAAILPRLQIAMPSCYFCTFRASIMSLYHCSCNYVPGLLQYAEMADIMGLFAPKPVVIVAGQQDHIFPIESTRDSFARLQQIYKAAGAPQNCRLVEGPQGHRFYADLAWPEMLSLIGR